MQPENENWQPPTPQSGSAPLPATQPLDQPAEVAGSPVESTPEITSVAEPDPVPGMEQSVRWQASEYIYREKNQIWYIIFGIVVVGLIALAILVFRSYTFAVLVPVMATALVVYSRRAPPLLDYNLGRKGLHVNDRLYPYEQFREFGLIQGDDQSAVILVPRERFKPGVTVYFPDEAGEAIVDMLAARLPMHDVKLDPIDRFIRFLKI